MSDDEANTTPKAGSRALARLKVRWAGATFAFQDASALPRHPPDEMDTPKVRGQRRYSEISLVRGVYSGPTNLFDWYQSTKNQRLAIAVEVFDEAGRLISRLHLRDAFPLKVDGPSLNASGNDIAIESIVIAAEGLQLVGEEGATDSDDGDSDGHLRKPG